MVSAHGREIQTHLHAITPSLAIPGQRAGGKPGRFHPHLSFALPAKKLRRITAVRAHRTAWVLSVLGELICHR